MSKLQELQNRIGYTFEKEGLLRQAHAQWFSNEKHMKKHSDNETGVLGDAVLDRISDFYTAIIRICRREI